MLKMRSLVTILCICVAIVICLLESCSTDESQGMNKRLEDIWVMSDSSLDSAIESAKMLEDSIKAYDKKTRCRYDLLCIRLRDKQDIIPSSVDSAKTISEYLEKHGSLVDKMRAYHYLSSAYRDLHDSPNAILYDLKAAEVSEQAETKDSAMLEKIYSQLSTLYRQQLNISKSIEMAKKHYEVSSDIIWAAMDIANAYYFDGDYTSALQYYNECYSILVKDSAFIYHPSLHSELLYRYSEGGKMEKGDSLHEILKELPNTMQPSNYNSAMGKYFLYKDMLDSAIVYYKRETDSCFPISYRCDASSALMKCYESKGEVDSIAKYAILYAQLNDSVVSDRKFEQARNADAEYRYRRNVEEETSILKRDEMLRKRIFATILVSVITILGGCMFYFYRQKRLLELILTKDKMIEDYSVENLRKQAALDTAIKNNETLDIQLSELYQQIEKKRLQNDALLQLALMRKTEENASEIIEKFKKASVGQHPLTENEWKELMAAIDDMYPTFKNVLQNKISRLTKPIIQTAYMMKAGISNPQIVNLMSVPRQTVWYRSNAIRKVLGDELQTDIGLIATTSNEELHCTAEQ